MPSCAHDFVWYGTDLASDGCVTPWRARTLQENEITANEKIEPGGYHRIFSFIVY